MLNFINFIKKFYPFLFFVIIVVLTVFLFQTRSTLKKERADRAFQEQLFTQNTAALKDSIKVEFNKKLKAWEFSKDNYVVQKLDDLEKYNKSLSDELKKIKGDVLAAIKTEVQGDLGGIKASDSLAILDEESNHYGIKFKSYYKDPGFEQKLSGISKFYAIPNESTKKWTIKPDSTIFDTNFTSIKITYGIKSLKDKYQVFALSMSPKIQLTDLTGGYFIDKQPTPAAKPKKWGIGPYLGYGINTATDLNTPRFGWSIGFAIHYDVLQFGKK